MTREGVLPRPADMSAKTDLLCARAVESRKAANRAVRLCHIQCVVMLVCGANLAFLACAALGVPIVWQLVIFLTVVVFVAALWVTLEPWWSNVAPRFRWSK